MKKIVTIILLIAVVAVGFGLASSKAQASTYTKKINKLTTVTITINNGSTGKSMAAKSTGWKTRNAKCVVKHFDDPTHWVLDYKYTVVKHWDYNVKLDEVRNVAVSTSCWMNAALKAVGDYSEEYSPMDFYYSRMGNDIMDAHYSARHASFHCIIGFKGFHIPVSTWKVTVKFWAFARNVKGKNQNWTCKVYQHMKMLS